MKTVLIVDSDPILLKAMEALLKTPTGQIDVLTIDSSHQALIVVEHLPIDMVITGLNIAELDGFELMTRLSFTHPSIRVIVMTDNASPIFRAKIRQSPRAIHFDKDFDINLLTNRIFTELQIEYGGHIRGINLSSFLQMIELEERTCTLQITAKNKIGFLYIRQGCLIDAKYEQLTGNAAALKILTWENVSINLDYAPVDRDEKITTHLMGLLLESGQKIDENKSHGINQRRHTRFNCLVAVDYDVNEWTYQCFLRDISLGGAYVETNQRIGIGQEIALSLSAPGQPQCVFKGEVVRRDKFGIGIRFGELGPTQIDIIAMLTKTDVSLKKMSQS